MAAIKKNIMVASAVLFLDGEEQTRKERQTRSIWTRLWILRRKIDGDFHTIFKEVKEQDSDGFKGYVRMDVDYFEELVHLLSPSLQKQGDNMRECVSPKERCCVTLRYLASGESFRSLKYQFQISKKAISYIVYEVAFAITQTLGKEHLKAPKITKEWKKIAENFGSLMEFFRWTWWSWWKTYWFTATKELWVPLQKL